MAVIAFGLLCFVLVEGALQLNNGQFEKLNPSGNPKPNSTALVSESGAYLWAVSSVGGQTFKYSVSNNQWTLTPAVLPLWNQGLSDLDDSAGLLFAFGGSTGFGAFNKIYYLTTQNPSEWKQFVDDGLITTRSFHTMTEMSGIMYIFGGWTQSPDPQYFADTWWFDTTTLYTEMGSANWTLSQTPYQPPARNAHTMVAFGGDLWLFGGFSHNTSVSAFVNCSMPYDNCIWYNDLWTYNAASDKWMQVYPTGPLPEGRNLHTASVVGENMYIFGGLKYMNVPVNDLWAYNVVLQVWKKLEPSGSIPAPGAVNWAMGVTIGGKVYYYGDKGELWAYNPHVNPDTTTTEESTSTTGLTAAITLNILISAAVAVLAYLIYRHTTREPSTVFNDYAPMKEGAKV